MDLKCAACNFLERECEAGCPFRNFVPGEDPQAFAELYAHKGLAKLTDMVEYFTSNPLRESFYNVSSECARIWRRDIGEENAEMFLSLRKKFDSLSAIDGKKEKDFKSLSNMNECGKSENEKLKEENARLRKVTEKLKGKLLESTFEGQYVNAGGQQLGLYMETSVQGTRAGDFNPQVPRAAVGLGVVDEVESLKKENVKLLQVIEELKGKLEKDLECPLNMNESSKSENEKLEESARLLQVVEKLKGKLPESHFEGQDRAVVGLAVDDGVESLKEENAKLLKVIEELKGRLAEFYFKQQDGNSGGQQHVLHGETSSQVPQPAGDANPLVPSQFLEVGKSTGSLGSLGLPYSDDLMDFTET